MPIWRSSNPFEKGKAWYHIKRLAYGAEELVEKRPEREEPASDERLPPGVSPGRPEGE